MNTETIRMNITLLKDLVALLDEIAGPRKRSRFIAQALRMIIEQQNKPKWIFNSQRVIVPGKMKS